MSNDILRILAIGAHPDDCDGRLGGMATMYAQLGHKVKFVSVTNGDAGHHIIGGAPLAKRRYQEAQEAAGVAGIDYQILDIHDGQLMPTLENRWLLVRIIREFQPDLIVTLRPNDYHPDHRYTSTLVQDAAYTVTVPNVEGLTPHLRHNPVIAYMADRFQRPYPFSPDVAVGIDDVLGKKLDMLHCHESQMYEWLPYNKGIEDQVPPGDKERREWLKEWRAPAFKETADQYRDLLMQLYGEKRGKEIRYAEALEVCEYGAPLDETNLQTLFPFFDGERD
ncbi:MAG: PIG-L family deacetylase [Anaerolineae bacterium]|nr:PIG-L family deacetylase [Anaerolineae bacterium]